MGVWMPHRSPQQGGFHEQSLRAEALGAIRLRHFSSRNRPTRSYAVLPISWVPKSRGLVGIVLGWANSAKWVISSRFTQR